LWVFHTIQDHESPGLIRRLGEYLEVHFGKRPDIEPYPLGIRRLAPLSRFDFQWADREPLTSGFENEGVDFVSFLGSRFNKQGEDRATTGAQSLGATVHSIESLMSLGLRRRL